MNKLKKALIVGAGDAGKTIVRELLNSDKVQSTPVCFVDDDPNKQTFEFHGVKVAGTTDDISSLCTKFDIDEIFICMPSANKVDINRIYEECKKTNCKVKTIPGIYQFINGEVLTNKVRDLDVTDLLFRKPINVLTSEMKEYYKDKVILVTGGGGSIGSEIVRQLAKMSPKQIVVLDIYENCAYDLQQELKILYDNKVNLQIEICSITNKRALDRVFNVYKPNIVIMAAAHKHVPLMEHNVIEAIENNVFGTLNTIEIAEKYGVDRVHLVSTDKAVKPTNVMGSTKRVCEMLCLNHAGKKQHTTFSITRFGNVLGSAGSVIPLFKRQIAAGGPLTITHKDITRYFITIPEASQLVLCSASLAKNGELFVLDMGEPIKILDLAETMIRLEGYVPYKQIDIKETGLRPGEKMYEELLVDTAKLGKTKNPLIFLEKEEKISDELTESVVNKLSEYCDNNSVNEATKYIIEIANK